MVFEIEMATSPDEYQLVKKKRIDSIEKLILLDLSHGIIHTIQI